MLGICRLPNLRGPGGSFLVCMLARGPVGTVTPEGNPGGGRSPCGTRALDFSEFIVARFHPDWEFCTESWAKID